MRRESRNVADPGAVLLAGPGAIGVAMALVSLRGHVANADIALVLVLVVVAAAVAGGRATGALAAVIATMAFDFFHTRPYLSLKIMSAEDVETTVLLLLVGVAVGQVAVMSRQRRYEAAEGRSEVESLYRVAEQAARDPDPERLVTAVRRELSQLLSLAECSFHRGPPPEELPSLEASGWIDSGGVHRYTGHGVELPVGGVALPVRSGGAMYGHVLCVPVAGTGVSSERRRVAVALADQLGLGLAAAALENGARVSRPRLRPAHRHG
jgi:hypothetical protein